MLNIFDICKASSVKEAIGFLSAHEKAKVLAGGTDIIIDARKGKLEGYSLISIAELDEIKAIYKDSEGNLHIGACATFEEIINSVDVQDSFAAFAKAVSQIGSPQIRRVATIGGNISNGAVSADSIGLLIAMGSIAIVENEKGCRKIALSDIHTGPGSTVLSRTDIMREIIVPLDKKGRFGAAYFKYGCRNAMEIATLGCACVVECDENCISDISLVFTVAGPKPVCCMKAKEAALGQEISKETFEKIAEVAISEISPRDSWRASKEFRQQIAYEMAVRTIEDAVKDSKRGTI